MSKRFFLSLALLLGAGACSDPAAAVTPLVFNRPEHLGFVCLDATAATATDEKQQRHVVLPLRCCSADDRILAPTMSEYTPINPRQCGYRFDPLKDDDDPKNDNQRPVTPAPTLHALVTQSTRGEVAAYDVVRGRVIDTDRRVPGYTYLDVGGLPSAIVTPPTRFVTIEGVVNPDLRSGPVYTYVASAEELHVRAIPTCRFRSTRACGPETEAGFPRGEELFDAMRMPLPSPPRDMILGPDHALWVSLPDIGRIARIELDIRDVSAFPTNQTDEPVAGHTYERPFKGVAPQYFELSDLGELTPAEAVDDTAYRAACGLGYTMEATPVDLLAPASPSYESLDGPRPLRLRVDDVTGYLLVGDQSQPGIRAFDVSTGTPVLRGVIATGSPVREFVVTPFVPPTVLRGTETLPRAEVTVVRDEVRYLYAIDERDGSVLAQRLELDEDGSLSGTPLRLPFQTRYNDRITFASGAALSLEVIDTRDLSVPYMGAPLSDYRAKDGAPINSSPLGTTLRIRTAAELDRARATAKVGTLARTEAEFLEAVYDNASPAQLRGVFLAVTTSNGDLYIYDIHDLDVYGKARNFCDAATPTKLTTLSTALPVGIQRHAVRPYLNKTVSVSVSDRDAITQRDKCSDDYHAILSTNGQSGINADPTKSLVCARNEPWLSPAGTITLTYEGVLPTLAGVTGYVTETADGVTIMAPPGLDFCERGVLSTVNPKAGHHDSVVVTGSAATPVAGCTPPSSSAPVYLKVKHAYRDRLVLEASEGATQLLRCYPETLAYQVRGEGHFILSSSTFNLTPAMTADANGACIADPAGDPKLGFRGYPGALFQSPRLEFQIAADDRGTKFSRLESFSIAVSSTQTSVFTSIFDAAAGRPDSLPVTVRYLPYTGDLFIIDTASQGIRRYGLAPFGTSSTGVR